MSKILYGTGRNFLPQKETSCHRKKPPVTRRNLQSREETLCDRKKPPLTGRNFLSHKEAFKDEHNAEEEMEITENVPLL
jgi:hypothetical protein